MKTSFFEKLNDAIARNQSLLVVGLDPNPEMMPGGDESGERLDYRMSDLCDWLTAIVATTCDRVCAYKPTLGFYHALGIPGLELLATVLQDVPDEIPVILDAKHSDLNTATAFARTLFETWNIDAVTLNPYAGQDAAAPFLVYPDKAVFVLCRTSNPTASPLQDFPSLQTPFYLQVVKEARLWGPLEQLGFEVGTSQPEIFRQVRAIAPERLLLARSIWSEPEQLDALLRVGLDRNGAGLLLPVPQDWLKRDDLPEQLEELNGEIDRIRQDIAQDASTCELWTPEGDKLDTVREFPHRDLILQLYDLECILFGEYVQASGATFPYYIDLRKIISNPQLFHQVLHAYAEILQGLTFDRIAGLPYGALPTATGLSLRLHHPMIFPRKEVKAHGTRRAIEGHFHPGETVVVIDDILISGNSAIEGAQKLESAGLTVNDIVVFIDHEKGVKDRLNAKGYRAHSVLTISEIAETLYRSQRIDRVQFEAIAHSESF
ncbi:Orotidine 5'-phosphate decarboxylase [Geitlerinema sp. FC II]|nr:Orotidine 5'-phosphate decarboxylase [Geitlerinema sp. FC II]